MLGHKAVPTAGSGSGFNPDPHRAAAAPAWFAQTLPHHPEPARSPQQPQGSPLQDPPGTPTPYLRRRGPQSPPGWGRSQPRRPGCWPPLPSACSSWPRWLSASGRACGLCSGLLPGSAAGRKRDTVSAEDGQTDGRVNGVSPGLLGQLSSTPLRCAAIYPADIHPPGSGPPRRWYFWLGAAQSCFSPLT